MRTKLILVLAFATLLAAAQGAEYRASYREPSGWMGAATKGAPYSADQVTEFSQTLADGTRITRPTISQTIYRDSLGRTRTERAVQARSNLSPGEPGIVEIYDVVASYRYVLDPVNKVAHRSVIPPRPPPPPMRRPAGVPRPAPPKPDLEATTESLGTQVVEGLTCEGRLNKTTTPVGLMGNDRPLTYSVETWVSTELKITVLMKHRDLLRGDSTMQLKNVSRIEPEFSLFQPPPDYKIVDETGDFMLIIKIP